MVFNYSWRRKKVQILTGREQGRQMWWIGSKLKFFFIKKERKKKTDDINRLERSFWIPYVVFLSLLLGQYILLTLMWFDAHFVFLHHANDPGWNDLPCFVGPISYMQYHLLSILYGWIAHQSTSQFTCWERLPHFHNNVPFHVLLEIPLSDIIKRICFVIKPAFSF